MTKSNFEDEPEVKTYRVELELTLWRDETPEDLDWDDLLGLGGNESVSVLNVEKIDDE